MTTLHVTLLTLTVCYFVIVVRMCVLPDVIVRTLLTCHCARDTHLVRHLFWQVRLGDTSLVLEVERDMAVYGDECKFGGGKVGYHCGSHLHT